MKEKDFENLSAWIDGEADSETEKLVESSLQSDAQSATTCADLRKLNDLLDRWQTPEPKEALKDIICLSAKNSRRNNIFFRARVLIPIAAAAILVIAVMAVTLPWAGDTQRSANGFDWQSLSKNQQIQASQEARAFLALTPQQQTSIFQRAAKELSLSLTDDKQLGAVMASFSKNQMAQLKEMPFAERMQIIEKRRIELVNTGIIEK